MSEDTNTVPLKSSAEILSELFSTFNAFPPILKDKALKKHKKNKKKHKHKDKKHKKKSKCKDSALSSDDSLEKIYKHGKKRIKKESSDEENTKTVVTQSSISISDIAVKSEPKDKGYEKIENSSLNELDKETVQSELESNPENNCIKGQIVNETYVKDCEKSPEQTINQQNVGKIMIKSLKNSTVYEATIKEIEDKAKEKAEKFEDGEVTSESEDDIDNSSIHIQFTNTLENISSSSKNGKKRKHTHKNSTRERNKHDDTKKQKKDKHSRRSRSKEKDRDRHSSRRDKSDYYYNSSRSHKDKEYSNYDRDKYRDRNDKRLKESRRSRSREVRSRSRDERRSSSLSKSRKDRLDHRSNHKRPKSPSSSIDKKKLLEIARKNAINMLKSGTLPEALTLGPQAQEKVIAAIKAGGKTIEELTDFCKNLSQKEELGELSSVSSNEDEIDSNSEGEKVFHHPFQIKDKPTSIVMNIKNATALPVKTPKEKSAELRMQFPVSSGQLHRKTENEWVPVSPKKSELVAPLPIEAPPLPEPAPVPVPVPAPKPVAATVTNCLLPPFVPPKQSEVDISSIVSQRLNAMRKLQENPNDVQALNQMYKVQQEMQTWAQSKQQIGQFTGSTGAQILTPAELSSGYQAWARKDQLQNAAPVTGGMGMHLLQKMGWKPGEGLGKEKTGSLEPLLLEVKLDKKGLVADEEVKNKKPVKVQKNTVTTKTLAGKHPVSLLGEFATKRKLGVPQYECCFECGPDHKKNFLFKVILNGIEYKPNVASSTKKQAKADAATVCLQQLGLYTT